MRKVNQTNATFADLPDGAIFIALDRHGNRRWDTLVLRKGWPRFGRYNATAFDDDAGSLWRIFDDEPVMALEFDKDEKIPALLRLWKDEGGTIVTPVEQRERPSTIFEGFMFCLQEMAQDASKK